MSAVLGVNAVFHDPAAALVVDGEIVAAAEEERFTRRKHGKEAVPFATWELPSRSAEWCLREGRLTAADLDAVAYSYDPALAPPSGGDAADVTANEWEGLRTLYAQRAPLFLRTALPGLDPAVARFVPHHIAHAASTALAAPFPDSAVLVCDGRGEARSHWAGTSRHGELAELAAQPLPDSLGLMYEEVTEHPGFRRSSDEYKVMALAVTEAPAAVPPAAGVLATDPGALAAACRSFIDDPESARRAGLAAREHALARYGLRRFLADWDQLLTSLVQA